MNMSSALASTAVSAKAYLSVNNIEVIYDHVILVLKGVSLEVPQGKIVALLGANGAGKTTTLKAISNLLSAERGDVTKGTIEFEGKRVDKLTPNELVRRGVCQVMEGRHCFAHLTVEENLLTGAFTRRDSRADIRAALEKVYHYFPRLKERRASVAGYTSGGEQQMTAVGRALMARPTMILLDEPSMGLAPQIVEEIFEIVGNLNKQENVSFLLAEQNTNVALRFADYGYILENGRVDGFIVVFLQKYGNGVFRRNRYGKRITRIKIRMTEMIFFIDKSLLGIQGYDTSRTNMTARSIPLPAAG
jgi:branched-chain amino acid transport system ATP-binding protein